MHIGEEKVKSSGLDGVISFKKENCEHMSYADNTFDAITTAFGIRNFQNLDACLKEMCRVLKKRRTTEHLGIEQTGTLPDETIVLDIFTHSASTLWQTGFKRQ